MKIIFLDIDGVLNCELFFRDSNRPEAKLKHPLCHLSRDRILLLNDLCQTTGAKVVISSVWRLNGFSNCRKLLTAAGATFEVLDRTPNFGDSYSVRGNEILAWIRQNTKRLEVEYYGDFKTYVIFDDDSDMLLWQAAHFFHCDPFSGLTPNLCYKAKQFLQSTVNLNKIKKNRHNE